MGTVFHNLHSKLPFKLSVNYAERGRFLIFTPHRWLHDAQDQRDGEHSSFVNCYCTRTSTITILCASYFARDSLVLIYAVRDSWLFTRCIRIFVFIGEYK